MNPENKFLRRDFYARQLTRKLVNLYAMYAKLFSRITESSLMEEDIEVRYVFMMMLAIADPKGYIIGTDVAIARRINVPLDQFKECMGVLMSPDPESNSKEHEGRRLIPSDGERGYKAVNYVAYKELKTEDERRAYMREYMRKRRNGNGVADVNFCKTELAQLTHAEAEAEAEEKTLGVFPCDGRVKTWKFTDKHLAKLKEAFPSINILAEAKKAKLWIEAHPSRRKTARGMLSYLMGWMERAQNGGKSNGNGHQSPRPSNVII